MIQIKDQTCVLLCAFRYALGRRTYVVHTIVEEILNNWEQLSEHHREMIKREIREQEEMFDLGMDCDKNMWYQILNK